MKANEWLHWIDRWVRSWPGQLAAASLIVIVLALTVGRVVWQHDTLGGPYESGQGGMFDFHNGVYQPALGLRQGVIPYSQQLVDEYQVTRPTPAFSPWIIALHIPLTYLSLPIAEGIYFSLIVLMLMAMTALVIDEAAGDRGWGWWLPLIGLLLVSRPGHLTLFSGYFTAELVLGTLLALRFAHDRPWLSALGTLLASGKPTFAIPLGIILLVRGNYRSLVYGVLLSTLGALLPLLYLASNQSWSAILEALKGGQADHLADPVEFPVNTWTRIDFTAILAKWLAANPGGLVQLIAMLGWMAWPVWKLRALRRAGDDRGLTSPSGTIGTMAILLTLYHHVYDALLMVGPLVAIWGRGPLSRGFREFTPHFRLGLSFLMTAAWWNYTATESALSRLPAWPFLAPILSSINTLLLGVSLGLLLWYTPTERE